MLASAYAIAYYDIFPIFDADIGRIVGSNLGIVHESLEWEQEEARTVLLTIAIVAQSALVLSLRRLNKPIHRSLRQDTNWKMWPLIFSIPIFHVLLMYIPPLDQALVAVGIQFELVQLGLMDWVLILIMGLIPIGLLELAKIVWIRKDKIDSEKSQEAQKIV
jgi:magnesium-transporting ATPase (P-type)